MFAGSVLPLQIKYVSFADKNLPLVESNFRPYSSLARYTTPPQASFLVCLSEQWPYQLAIEDAIFQYDKTGYIPESDSSKMLLFLTNRSPPFTELSEISSGLLLSRPIKYEYAKIVKRHLNRRVLQYEVRKRRCLVWKRRHSEATSAKSYTVMVRERKQSRKVLQLRCYILSINNFFPLSNIKVDLVHSPILFWYSYTWTAQCT